MSVSESDVQLNFITDGAGLRMAFGEDPIKCWACQRRVPRSFSHDISLCRACGMFFQRYALLRWDAGRWRRFQLWIARKAYFLAMRLTVHPEYDR